VVSVLIIQRVPFLDKKITSAARCFYMSCVIQGLCRTLWSAEMDIFTDWDGYVNLNVFQVTENKHMIRSSKSGATSVIILFHPA
jgi:hypothetical protein